MGFFKSLMSGGLFGAASEAYQAHQQNKQAEKSLEAKIAEKKLDLNAQVEFNNQEWEKLAQWANESTWKDEYATVSVLLIFNLILLGGILTAFGYPQVLDGVTIALDKLNDVMVMQTTNVQTGAVETEYTPLGTIIVVTIFAAIGVYGWKKLVN